MVCVALSLMVVLLVLELRVVWWWAAVWRDGGVVWCGALCRAYCGGVVSCRVACRSGGVVCRSAGRVTLAR